MKAKCELLEALMVEKLKVSMFYTKENSIYINGYLKLYMHAYFITQSDTVQQYVVRISTRSALSILLVIRGLFITFSLHIS